MIYYQIRYKIDSRWLVSRVITSEDQAEYVYQEWAAVMMLLEPVGLLIPVRLCKIELGTVCIVRSNEPERVVQ